MKKYEIEYDNTVLTVVEIDHDVADKAIKEMVEFWIGWGNKLQENNNCYTTTWLKHLGRFIIMNNRFPQDDEGWVEMNGSFGITLTQLWMWEPQEDEIFITPL